jgi:hypothetical protein
MNPLTPEQKEEVEHRKVLEEKSLEHAVEWCRIGCKVGAADGFLIITFHEGEMFMAASDAALSATKTNSMIDKLVVMLSKFFGVDIVATTLRAIDGGMTQ